MLELKEIKRPDFKELDDHLNNLANLLGWDRLKNTINDHDYILNS